MVFVPCRVEVWVSGSGVVQPQYYLLLACLQNIAVGVALINGVWRLVIPRKAEAYWRLLLMLYAPRLLNPSPASSRPFRPPRYLVAGSHGDSAVHGAWRMGHGASSHRLQVAAAGSHPQPLRQRRPRGCMRPRGVMQRMGRAAASRSRRPPPQWQQPAARSGMGYAASPVAGRAWGKGVVAGHRFLHTRRRWSPGPLTSVLGLEQGLRGMEQRMRHGPSSMGHGAVHVERLAAWRRGAGRQHAASPEACCRAWARTLRLDRRRTQSAARAG